MNRLPQPTVLGINLAFLFALIPFPACLTDNKVCKANSETRVQFFSLQLSGVFSGIAFQEPL